MKVATKDGSIILYCGYISFNDSPKNVCRKHHGMFRRTGNDRQERPLRLSKWTRLNAGFSPDSTKVTFGHPIQTRSEPTFQSQSAHSRFQGKGLRKWVIASTAHKRRRMARNSRRKANVDVTMDIAVGSWPIRSTPNPLKSCSRTTCGCRKPWSTRTSRNWLPQDWETEKGRPSLYEKAPDEKKLAALGFSLKDFPENVIPVWRTTGKRSASCWCRCQWRTGMGGASGWIIPLYRKCGEDKNANLRSGWSISGCTGNGSGSISNALGKWGKHVRHHSHSATLRITGDSSGCCRNCTESARWQPCDTRHHCGKLRPMASDRSRPSAGKAQKA